MNDISIIGLGKLGASMLAAFASKDFKVVGVEIDKTRADLLRQGKSFHLEANLEELLTKHKNNITITESYHDAIKDTSTTFVVVNTPSEKDGSFSTKQLIPACQKIGEVLREKNDYHLVVITCTVMPETVRKEVVPILESESRKKLNIDFGVCYNPEFIALGTVIHDLLNPDFVLIGESDKKSGDALQKIYEKLIDKPKIQRITMENAEVAKIALNSYITMKISFANLLAKLCEKIPNGNVDAVTESIGLDSRIGKKYLKGAVSYGGPCFPRDNRAFSLTAKLHDCPIELPDLIDNINNNHIKHIANIALQYSNNGKVSILGASYKPDSDIIEASPGIEIGKTLVDNGIKVAIHDPSAINNVKRDYGSIFQCAESINECLQDSNVCIIVTPWKEYQNLQEKDFAKMKDSVIIDCWRILKFPSDSKFKIIKIGIGN